MGLVTLFDRHWGKHPRQGVSSLKVLFLDIVLLDEMEASKRWVDV